MIGVSAGPILPDFGPVPTAVDMPVGVLRRKHDYKKKKNKYLVLKAVFHSSLTFTRMKLNPFFKSSLVNHVDSCTCSIKVVIR